MEKRQRRAPAEEIKRGKITARVIDEDNGVQVTEHVRAIRILSKDYVLLIMEDYAATLGTVEGDVVIISDSGEISLENIHGFYKHNRNEFTLLVVEERDGWYEKA